jgi:hypothetical protein
MALLRLRYVHSFVDKTGRARYYFRYRGKRWPLPGEPGISEFAAAYSEAKREAGGGEPQPRPPANLRYGPKSLGHVIDRYIASNDFTKTTASTQRRYRPILEEATYASDISASCGNGSPPAQPPISPPCYYECCGRSPRKRWRLTLASIPPARFASCIGIKSLTSHGRRN